MSTLCRLGVAALLLAPLTTRAQESREVSRFQDPTQERAIESAEEDELGEEEAPVERPENLEERLYLRERPDSLGTAARTYQAERLQALLESRESLVTERRALAIQLLEEFIRVEPEDAAEMPDALMRLAELTWENARVEYLAAFGAWQAVPEANRGPAPMANYDGALRLYDRILDRHPDFERIDLVFYMKAYALLERGDSEGALDQYRRILVDHPQSRFVADAHFALAESSFSEGVWSDALQRFERVMEYRESELFDLSLFKSAWCLWRLDRTQDAALRFRQVLDLGRGRGNMSAAQRRRLRELQDEALDYLIQVFIEDENNTARDVFAFLEDIGGERYAQRVLVRLSDTYIGQARFEPGIEAYQLLLEMDPMARDAPKYQREIASAYASLGDTDKTIESMATLAATYEAGGEWAQQQGDSERVRREVRRNERLIRRQAMRYHEVGQAENPRPELERAVALYGIYLEHFEEEEPAYEVQFYQAEILFHRLERYPEAGDAYLAAARKNRQGPYTRDALYNAIGAYERVREGELENCNRAPTDASDATADDGAPVEGAEPDEDGAEGEGEAAAPPDNSRCGETDNDRKFASAIELYVELFPDDPDLPEILFRQGRLYYDRGIYDPAVQLFGQLLERFPESEYAAPAGELILDSFNRAEDYGNIEQWARRLLSAPAFSSDESQTRLRGLILQSMFKVGEQLGERGEHAEAAAAYRRAADEFPEDRRAPQALFNAGAEFQRAGDLRGADDVFTRLIERHPGSEEGARGAWAGAQMYESIAQFGDAARFYQAYGESFPDAEKVADALYNAVLLRVTGGDNSEAVSVGRLYLERFPRREEADDVSFFIGRAQAAAGDLDEAATTYRQYIRRSRNNDRKIEAQTRLALVLEQAGDERASATALAAAVRTSRRGRNRLRDGLYFAAQARFIQGERVLRRYEAVPLAGDPAGLRDRLQQKSELLAEAAEIFADVVRFGVAEWVTASLFQIGRSYELFANGMREFEVPEGLTEEEEQVYFDQLAMFIVPMEERALEAYEGGYQRAIELSIYNRWTAQLREALTRLNDVQYPPLRETGGGVVEAPPLAPPERLGGLRRGEEEGDEDDDGDGADEDGADGDGADEDGADGDTDD
ncbi:MAG: tetratricopeptide repeat protein [Myxococcota bacterium]